MAGLSQAKMLGGIGSILIFIPFVSLIGYILIIVAVKQVSDELQDRTVFNNILIAAISGIVGAFVAGFIVISVITSLIASTSAAPTPPTDIFGAVFGAVAVLLVVWIAMIISAVFLRRAYDTIAQRLGVGTFRTAATLYLIGAALTVVLVGFLLLFIAEILQAIAYFSIPDRPPMQGTGGSLGPMGAPPPPMPPPGGATKFCVSCGNKISGSATFCNNCGAKQPQAQA